MKGKIHIAEFNAYAKRCEAALIDVDNTAVDTNVSEGIGKRYLIRELERRHYGNVCIGLYGAALTLYYQKLRRDERTALEKFIGALNTAGCVDLGTTEEFAEECVRKHLYPGMKEFVKYLKSGGLRTIVHTGGLDVSAKAVKEEVSADDSIGNYTIKGNTIVPYGQETGLDKCTRAEKYLSDLGMSIADCLVVGDAGSDLPLMHMSALSLASPKAEKEVIEAADLWVSDYRSFEIFGSMKLPFMT